MKDARIDIVELSRLEQGIKKMTDREIVELIVKTIDKEDNATLLDQDVRVAYALGLAILQRHEIISPDRAKALAKEYITYAKGIQHKEVRK